MHVEADLLMAGIAVNNLLDIEGKQRKKKKIKEKGLFIYFGFLSHLVSYQSTQSMLLFIKNTMFFFKHEMKQTQVR